MRIYTWSVGRSSVYHYLLGVSIVLTVEQYLSTCGTENENGKKWECVWESYRFGGRFPGMVTDLLLTCFFVGLLDGIVV